jgi:hypothetical protein
MTYRYNPISGNLDIVGGSSGPPPAAVKYSLNFNATTDWTVDGAIFKLVILESTHGAGVTPVIQVFESIAADFVEVSTSVTFNASGDVTLSVTSIPDNRFAGKIIIF